MSVYVKQSTSSLKPSITQATVFFFIMLPISQSLHVNCQLVEGSS
jgi:hypothetical protein